MACWQWLARWGLPGVASSAAVNRAWFLGVWVSVSLFCVAWGVLLAVTGAQQRLCYGNSNKGDAITDFEVIEVQNGKNWKRLAEKGGSLLEYELADNALHFRYAGSHVCEVHVVEEVAELGWGKCKQVLWDDCKNDAYSEVICSLSPINTDCPFSFTPSSSPPSSPSSSPPSSHSLFPNSGRITVGSLFLLLAIALVATWIFLIDPRLKHIAAKQETLLGRGGGEEGGEEEEEEGGV